MRLESFILDKISPVLVASKKDFGKNKIFEKNVFINRLLKSRAWRIEKIFLKYSKKVRKSNRTKNNEIPPTILL